MIFNVSARFSYVCWSATSLYCPPSATISSIILAWRLSSILFPQIKVLPCWLTEKRVIVSLLRKIQECDHMRLTFCGHLWITWVQFKYTFCQRKLLRACLKKQSTCFSSSRSGRSDTIYIYSPGLKYSITFSLFHCAYATHQQSLYSNPSSMQDVCTLLFALLYTCMYVTTRGYSVCLNQFRKTTNSRERTYYS